MSRERDAAGWDLCLDRLAATAAGRPTESAAPSAAWHGYDDEYRRQGLPASAPLPH